MGFLSRKTKPAPVSSEDPHPIVEELKRMEEAVPERPDRNDKVPQASAAGPVAEGAPEPQPAGPVAGQGSPARPLETPDPTPPAGEARNGSAAVVAEEPDEGPERFMPRDLIAPSPPAAGPAPAPPTPPTGAGPLPTRR